MNIKRIWSIFVARNKEFYRDRAGFFWNLLFPVIIIVSFGFIFSSGPQDLYKVGIIKGNSKTKAVSELVDSYKKIKYTTFIEFESFDEAETKLLHHKLDMVIDPENDRYLVSDTAPKGYVTERLMLSSGQSLSSSSLTKQIVTGREIPYIEWVLPGILGMNLMFAALYGIGYVIVRYRKNGVLKRFQVTPLKSYEFLIAHALSRIMIMIIVSMTLFVLLTTVYGFEIKGSLLDIFILFTVGSTSLVSIGLIIASRNTSEEFTDGMLNLVSWPMMFLSEVWFSLEGAHEWVKVVSKCLPLTYLVDGVRRIMNDGATLYELRLNIIILLAISTVSIFLGSILFRWNKG